jgi:hypothetical protein
MFMMANILFTMLNSIGPTNSCCKRLYSNVIYRNYFNWSAMWISVNAKVINILSSPNFANILTVLRLIMHLRYLTFQVSPICFISICRMFFREFWSVLPVFTPDSTSERFQIHICKGQHVSLFGHPSTR